MYMYFTRTLPESDVWSTEEIECYQQALLKHNKDFYGVAGDVGSKSVKQCVEFYYVWKKVCPDEYKRLRLLRRRRKKDGDELYSLRSRGGADVAPAAAAATASTAASAVAVSAAGAVTTVASSGVTSSATAPPAAEARDKLFACQYNWCNAVSARLILSVPFIDICHNWLDVSVIWYNYMFFM